MIRSSTIILLLLVLGTGALAWWPRTAFLPPELASSDTAGAIMAADEVEAAGRLRIVRYEGAERHLIDIEEQDGAWVLASHQGGLADASRVQSLLSQLAGREFGRLIGRGPALIREKALEDPLAESASPQHSGCRVSVWSRDRRLLCDLIVGGRIDDRPGSEHIVRAADSEGLRACGLEVNLRSKAAYWSADLASLLRRAGYELRPEKLRALHLVSELPGSETLFIDLFRASAATPWKDRDDFAATVDKHGVRRLLKLVSELRPVDYRSLQAGAQLAQMGIIYDGKALTNQFFGQAGSLTLVDEEGFHLHLNLGSLQGLADARPGQYRSLLIEPTYDPRSDKQRPMDDVEKESSHYTARLKTIQALRSIVLKHCLLIGEDRAVQMRPPRSSLILPSPE